MSKRTKPVKTEEDETLRGETKSRLLVDYFNTESQDLLREIYKLYNPIKYNTNNPKDLKTLETIRDKIEEFKIKNNLTVNNLKEVQLDQTSQNIHSIRDAVRKQIPILETEQKSKTLEEEKKRLDDKLKLKEITVDPLSLKNRGKDQLKSVYNKLSDEEQTIFETAYDDIKTILIFLRRRAFIDESGNTLSLSNNLSRALELRKEEILKNIGQQKLEEIKALQDAINAEIEPLTGDNKPNLSTDDIQRDFDMQEDRFSFLKNKLPQYGLPMTLNVKKPMTNEPYIYDSRQLWSRTPIDNNNLIYQEVENKYNQRLINSDPFNKNVFKTTSLSPYEIKKRDDISTQTVRQGFKPDGYRLPLKNTDVRQVPNIWNNVSQTYQSPVGLDENTLRKIMFG